MVETLLIIAICILVLLLILIIYFVFFKKASTVENEIVEKVRVNTIYDLQASIKLQKDELDSFKSLLTENIYKFEKSNQNEIVAFLTQTKTLLTALQTEFNVKTTEVNNNNKEQVNNYIFKTSKELNELKTKIISEINETNTKNNEFVNTNNLKTQETINKQITDLKEQVKKSLELGFEKNEKALQDFIEKMALLEANSRQMENLQKEISRFNQILNDQKARGNFGEGVLEQIFYNIFGDDKDNYFYQKQVNLTKEFNAKPIKSSKGTLEPTVDFVYYIQTEHEKLPVSIDAKFPYTNYIKLLDENLNSTEKMEVEKLFKNNVKDRIREVSKYIINGITAPYAIMFIPAEAVFLDIYKNYPDLVEEARRLRVIIASPSLIITIIQMMQVILKDYRKRNNANEILKMIDDISSEFNRFVIRFEDHKKRIEQLNDSVSRLDITNNKITKQLDNVKNFMDQDDLELNEEEEIEE